MYIVFQKLYYFKFNNLLQPTENSKSSNRIIHGSHFSHHFWLIFDPIFIFYCQIIENGPKMTTMNNPNAIHFCWPEIFNQFSILCRGISRSAYAGSPASGSTVFCSASKTSSGVSSQGLKFQISSSLSPKSIQRLWITSKAVIAS